jgi:hypothetical protein
MFYFFAIAYPMPDAPPVMTATCCHAYSGNAIVAHRPKLPCLEIWRYLLADCAARISQENIQSLLVSSSTPAKKQKCGRIFHFPITSQGLGYLTPRPRQNAISGAKYLPISL